MEEKIVPIHCIVCDEHQPEGLELLGKHICTSCEREIVSSEVHELKYLYFVFRLRALLTG